MFLHVADPVGVVGLRRGRLTVNWQRQGRGRSCPVGMGWRAEAKVPVFPLACHCVSLDWTGHLACLAEIRGLFTTGRVA